MTDIIPLKRTLKPQDLVLRFMNSLGHKHDAEVYLKLFTSKNPESFAIIVIEDDVLKDDMDAIIFEIRYLMRLSLFPVVVVQSGMEELEKLEVENYFKKAKLTVGFLSSDLSSTERQEFIHDRIKNKSLPVLYLNSKQDLFAELSQVAADLKTGKVIFLRRHGGIIDAKTEELVSIINLRFEHDSIKTSDTYSDEDKAFIAKLDGLISQCNHKLYVSVVSPNNLLRELFTVKGAGTLVQRGSKINVYAHWADVDTAALKHLLELSFEKRVCESFFSEKVDHFYIEENYMGAALLKNHENMTYLSKFAVGTEARGLGIGRDLWTEILKNNSCIFWRSDPEKFITHWYVKQCDGMHKTKNWVVFWKGVESSQITNAIEYALAQKIDFE
jgi:acetylglutamate synthase